ncbi:MAG: hypothetical protein P1P82_14355 [Bacteroidales bacterium]|nr:hypothetical protein [Bacteroidales bacterium]MDT8432223.1 hypothetical protein [Bacteroidales bacterium]
MKHIFLILTTFALIALSACNNKAKEAAATAAEAAEAAASKAMALENASADFLSTVGSFDFDILTTIKTNAGKNFMMYQLPAKTVIGVEYGEHALEVELTKDYVVKKLPGTNAFFKGDHRITTWSPSPTGYGVEYHAWPGKVVSTDLLMTYADDKLVRGGVYDGWLQIESIAHLKESMERGKKVTLTGNVPLYYVHVYEYKGVTKGALKSRHLLFADSVR